MSRTRKWDAPWTASTSTGFGERLCWKGVFRIEKSHFAYRNFHIAVLISQNFRKSGEMKGEVVSVCSGYKSVGGSRDRGHDRVRCQNLTVQCCIGTCTCMQPQTVIAVGWNT